jgi:multiple sugar transport system permease protein
VLPSIVFASVFFAAPLVLMVWISLNNWPLLGAHEFAGLTNYRQAVSDPLFRSSLLFSLEFTGIVTAAVFVVGGLLAALVAVRRRGVGIFRTIYFLPVVVGMASAAYLWLWMLDPDVGLIDHILLTLHIGHAPIEWLGSTNLAVTAVSVMTIWKLSGFAMIVIMSGLQSIPEEILESARVDGAGRGVTWLRIKLPLLRRQIALVLIFALAGSFLAFDQFFIMTAGAPNDSTVTAVFQIYNTSFVSFNLGLGSALALIVMAILLVFSLVQLLIIRSSVEY